MLSNYTIGFGRFCCSEKPLSVSATEILMTENDFSETGSLSPGYSPFPYSLIVYRIKGEVVFRSSSPKDKVEEALHSFSGCSFGSSGSPVLPCVALRSSRI